MLSVARRHFMPPLHPIFASGIGRLSQWNSRFGHPLPDRRAIARLYLFVTEYT
jgi:hypothetical protein